MDGKILLTPGMKRSPADGRHLVANADFAGNKKGYNRISELERCLTRIITGRAEEPTWRRAAGTEGRRLSRGDPRWRTAEGGRAGPGRLNGGGQRLGQGLRGEAARESPVAASLSASAAHVLRALSASAARGLRAFRT